MWPRSKDQFQNCSGRNKLIEQKLLVKYLLQRNQTRCEILSFTFWVLFEYHTVLLLCDKFHESWPWCDTVITHRVAFEFLFQECSIFWSHCLHFVIFSDKYHWKMVNNIKNLVWNQWLHRVCLSHVFIMIRKEHFPRVIFSFFIKHENLSMSISTANLLIIWPEKNIHHELNCSQMHILWDQNQFFILQTTKYKWLKWLCGANDNSKWTFSVKSGSL